MGRLVRITMIVLCCSQISVWAEPTAAIHETCIALSTANALSHIRTDSTERSAFEVSRELVLTFGPRPAGSPAEHASAEWAASALRSMRLDAVQSQAFTFEGWQRGTADLSVLSIIPIALPVSALGGSSATPPSGIEAPVIGFSDLKELDAAPIDAINGHVVFLNVRMRRTRDRSGYQEAVTARRDGAVHAARKGALALIIRSIGTDQERVPHAGWSRSASDVPRIPAVALSNQDADFLVDYMKLKRSATVRIRSSAQAVPSMTSQNVIGQVSATPQTRKTVLMAAHIDSWDVGMGAEDDAAGVGVVVSGLQRLLPYRALLRRNVRVVLFGAEELGGVGAEAYAKRSSVDVQHVVAVEADLGSGALWRLQLPDPRHLRAIDTLLADVVKPYGAELSLDAKAFGGTDVEPLSTTGTALYDLDPDASVYFDIHHTDRDALGRVSKENLDRQSRAFAAWALLMATTPDACLKNEAPDR